MMRATASTRSPTMCLAPTRMPSPARPSVTVSELVSSRGGISSSLPTATISAVVSGGRVTAIDS
jgi:hypothetical protein